MRADIGFWLVVIGVPLIIWSSYAIRGCRAEAGEEPVAAPSKALEEAWQRAGENAPLLRSALAALSEGAQRQAGEFLIAHMPDVDLASMDADLIVEHVRYAFLARKIMPWGESIPEEIFRHYVLPHRVSEERPSPWRRYFYQQLAALAHARGDLLGAAHAVNVWLGRGEGGAAPRVRFVQTEFRDLGPLETLLSGYGRCEEMMIVYIAAARSVGIPARAVWTPWWATGDSNHAWVEVWSDGVWHPLGACEPGSGDRIGPAWFSGRAERAAAVRAAVYGRPEAEALGDEQKLGGLLYRDSGRHVELDVTAQYAHTCRIGVVVETAPGEKARAMPVTLSVFNFGGFRAFFQTKTDAQGRATLYAGRGDYLLSAGAGPVRGSTVVHARGNELLTVLQLQDGAGPPEDLVLSYPTPQEARHRQIEGQADQDEARSEGPKKSAPADLPAPGPELHRYERFEPDACRFLMGLVSEAERERFTLKLQDAGGRWRAIAEAWARLPEHQRPLLARLLDSLAHLDLVELDCAILLDHVTAAAAARSQAPWKLPDDVFEGHVLAAQFPYAHQRPWRGALRERLKELLGEDLETTARAVNEWTAKHLALRGGGRGRFAPAQDPLSTVSAGGGDAYELTLATTACLRALAIPARAADSFVEIFKDGAWLPLYPLEPGRFGDKGHTEAARAAYAAPAILKPTLTANGASLAPEAWSLSRWGAGQWEPLREAELHEGVVSLAPGEYLLTAGVRNANGDVRAVSRLIEAKTGETIELNLAIEPPPTPTGPTLVRDLEHVPALRLTDARGEDFDLAGALKERHVVLVFFSLEQEPALRMLPLLDGQRQALEAAGAEMVALYLGQDGLAGLKADGRLAALALRLLEDRGGAAASRFIPELKEKAQDRLPSVLVLERGTARPLFWGEGYNLNIAADVLAALPGSSSGK